MAAPSTYTPEQKAAMAELTLDEGMTIRQAQATLEAGYKNVPPCKPSLQTIADEKNKAQLARTPDIPSEEPAALVDGLARRSLALIGKQLTLIEKTPASFDADDMLKIVRTLVEAKSLAQPARNKGKDKPESLLGGLHAVANTETDPTQQQPAAVRSSHA